MIAGQLKGLERHPPGSPNGRVEAHRFGDNAVGKGQVGQVVQSRRTPGQRIVQLGMKAGLDVGVDGKEMPGPGEGHGGGFVAGHEQGDHFIPQLGVGHHRLVRVGGVLIPYLQQH